MTALLRPLFALKYWFLALAVVWCSSSYFQNSFDPYWLKILITAGINVMLAVSLNLVNGHTGQFSMGHAGFMSVGAYTSAVITLALSQQMALGEGYSVGCFVLSLIAGGLLAAFAGFLVGMPSLRLRGDYLAIVTLGFGEIIRVLFLNINAVGGARGLSGIPKLATFGWVMTGAIVTVFVCWRLINASYGRAFLAVREDEIAAEAVGVPTTAAKVKAFMIGAFFAGVAGGLFAHDLQVIEPAIFDFNMSFEIIIMVVLGGMGSISGAIIAAVFLTVLKEALRPLQEFTGLDLRMVIYSLLLIVIMLTRPNGLLGKNEISDLFRKLRKRCFG